MAAGPIGGGVKATCRACGGSAMADSFKLHYIMKMMVCPACFSGKTQKEKEQKEVQKAAEPIRPPGWDKEDEYLEKAARMKKESAQPQFARIPGTDFVRHACMSCKYQFKYDPQAKVPRSCPYCNYPVPVMKASYLV